MPSASLGRAFGFHRAGDTLGAVVGPLLGLAALAVVDGDVRAAMWWAVVPAVLSVALTLFVREPARPVRVDAGESPESTPSELPPHFWRVTGTLALIALVNFSDALLLLRVLDLGFSANEMVAAYVVFTSVYATASYPAGALADRWPKNVVYAVGLAAFAVGYLGLGLVEKGAIVYALIGVYGLFPAFTDGVGKAWIATLVPREHLGRAQGVYQALISGATLVAGLWAGLLWNLGPGDGRLPLVISGAIGAVAAVVLGVAPRRARAGSQNATRHTPAKPHR